MSFLCVIIIMIAIFCAYLLQKIKHYEEKLKQSQDMVLEKDTEIKHYNYTVSILLRDLRALESYVVENNKRIRGDTALRRENRCKKIMNSI